MSWGCKTEGHGRFIAGCVECRYVSAMYDRRRGVVEASTPYVPMLDRPDLTAAEIAALRVRVNAVARPWLLLIGAMLVEELVA